MGLKRDKKEGEFLENWFGTIYIPAEEKSWGLWIELIRKWKLNESGEVYSDSEERVRFNDLILDVWPKYMLVAIK